MKLQKGIKNETTMDQREMQLFLQERQFWSHVLERIIDIVKFLSEGNFDLEVSKKCSAHRKMIIS